MPKAAFKKYLPDIKTIKEYRVLKLFGKVLYQHDLWHFNRRCLARAAAIGLFVAFMPLPIQMLIAAGLAILFRANLPFSVLLVWISNPLTMTPIFFFSYKFGAFLLELKVRQIEFQLSFHWLLEQLIYIWKPLLLGSFICGAVASMVGYLSIHIIWRIMVLKRWRLRKLRKKAERH